jgi:hypothetical protein
LNIFLFTGAGSPYQIDLNILKKLTDLGQNKGLEWLSMVIFDVQFSKSSSQWEACASA